MPTIIGNNFITAKKFLHRICVPYCESGNKQGGVTVTKETEIVAQCVTVDGFPVTIHKGRHQQKQGALGLMEISHQHLHNMVIVPWGNDNLCT